MLAAALPSPHTALLVLVRVGVQELVAAAVGGRLLGAEPKEAAEAPPGRGLAARGLRFPAVVVWW